MKKFASLLLAVLMICTMIPFAAIPASAEDTATLMTETGTCHVKLKKDVSAYIKFTPSVSDNYIFISNIPEDTPGNPHMVAYLYEGTRKVVSYQPTPTGDKNFCISYSFKAGKTYKLEIQLKNVTSCTADVSLMKEVIPEGICEISGKCIIRQTGTFECEYFIVNANSSVIIDRNTTVNVKQGLANHGKIELLGKLDSYWAYAFQPGDINIVGNGSLVDPDIKPSYYRHIIIWHKNGGTLTGISSAGDIYCSSYKSGTVVKMYEIKKDGYSFVGWYDNPDFNGNPVTEIGANETGNKDFYARFCNHKHFSSVSLDTGKDKFDTEKPVYYQCDDCGLYCEDSSGQNMIGDKNALDEWLVKWYNVHILSCRYIDVSLDDSKNVISAEKIIDSTDFYTVNTDDTAWGTVNTETWYVCTGNVTVNNRIDIIGNVHLIIRDGCTLTANKGITVEEGNVLSIYAQTDDESKMGKLNIAATGENGSAGVTAIGGSNGANDIKGENGGGGRSGGTVNLCGGEISLKTSGAACIGGGNGGNCEVYGVGGNGGNGCNVNIYGGIVSLDSSGAACIGGGNGGNCGERSSAQENPRGGHGGSGGNVNIYAGEISLKSSSGVCIGGGNGGNGGYGGDNGTAYINDGGNGGNGGTGSNVNLYGGKISLDGSGAACIGGGNGGNGGNGGDGAKPHPYAPLQGAGNGGAGGNGGIGNSVKVYGGEISLITSGSVCIGGGNGGNGGKGGNLGRDISEGAGGNGGNGAESSKVYFYGGYSTLKTSGTVCIGGGVGGDGGSGGDGGGYSGDNGSSGSLTTDYLNIYGTPVMKAGDSAESVTLLKDVSEYTNQPYLSVQYNSVSALGSVLSQGSIWIIAAVAVVAVAGAAALIIVKKKKKPALADGIDKAE